MKSATIQKKTRNSYNKPIYILKSQDTVFIPICLLIAEENTLGTVLLAVDVWQAGDIYMENEKLYRH
jgi:hypothetical protein